MPTMKRHYELYESLIKSSESESTSSSSLFWHLVVITAINSRQKECYERQIKLKRNLNRLPRSLKFMVISDPDEVKIGSGGALLNSIHKLSELYGSPNLFEMKVLIILSSGYSQRMPTLTGIGKIFASIPADSDYVNDMLDLKLANFLPFSVHMAPGVYVTCADEFATFDLDEQISCGKLFGRNGNHFMLIAHKSSLEMGKDHGVYALLDRLDSEDSSSCGFNCKFVVQKPSVDKMRKLNMVLKDSATTSIEYVYSDSSFYFSHEITKVLLEFHNRHFESMKEHRIDIDAYRDYLQPLGKHPMSINEYLNSCGSFCSANSSSIHGAEYREKMFKDLYEMLSNKQTIVLPLTDSKFYHLGTLVELFDQYFNENAQESAEFRCDLCFKKIKSATLSSSSSSSSLMPSIKEQLNSIIIHSKFDIDRCRITSKSIIEYCWFDPRCKLIVNENCLLNNCMLDLDEIVIKDENEMNTIEYEIPANICLHTMPIRFENRDQYVTIFFGKDDDLKKIYSDFRSIRFLGREINSAVSDDKNLNDAAATIWNLRIFKPYLTMSESFYRSVRLISNYLLSIDENKKKLLETSGSLSIFDMLPLLKLENLISYRLNRNLI